MRRIRRAARWCWPQRGARYQGETAFKYNAIGFLLRAGVYLAIGFVAFGVWYSATMADRQRDEHGNLKATYSQWCDWLTTASDDTCYR